VTGTVLDSLGNVVAVFKNGQLISSSNDWIRITTSDNGNWLRLPVDDTYRIEFEISDDTVLNIKVTEYSVYDNEEVRTATSDSKYDWKEINLRTRDDATLVVSALDETDGKYTMGSLAAYYLDLLRRYSVTYVLDGGMLNGTSGDISQYYDDGTGIALPEPTREGYRFAYWEGSRYNAGDVFMVTADHIFKAIWEKISGAEAPSEPVNVQPETAAKEAPAKEPAAATAQSSTVSKKTTGKAAPLTGDETPTDIYLMLLVLSGLTGMFLIRSRKQKKDSAA
jgi:hypothetical protein